MSSAGSISSSQPCFQGMMCITFSRSPELNRTVVRAIVRRPALESMRATAALPALRWRASRRSAGRAGAGGAGTASRTGSGSSSVGRRSTARHYRTPILEGMPQPRTRAPRRDPLRARLRELTLRDEYRLGRRLDRLPDARARERLERDIAAAQARMERRRAAVPTVTYPPELPVSARRDDLLAAIRDHQVVVVAGETGSGKTTQIPKLCLELGRGVRGAIAHTQPRRLAARTVAERIADELKVPLGGAVGFAVRFSDRSSDETLVRLVTDGLLLAEIHHDPLLRRYDTIIVDEAHERSLNIDFLLGYLHRILPRRPDLEVIITSGTIDPERFAKHFGDAPVVAVSGRTYP